MTDNYYIRILYQDSLTILSSLKREIRFSMFDVVALNKTMMSVEEATFKQFHDKQALFVHVKFHKSISEIVASKFNFFNNTFFLILNNITKIDKQLSCYVIIVFRLYYVPFVY